MNLLNEKVVHSSFGIGTITEVKGNFITVKFSSRESKFIYPDAFEKFIQAQNNEVQNAILAEISATKKLTEEKKQAELALIESRKQQLVATPKAPTTVKHYSTPAPTKRTSGKPMTFYVFQGSTFDKEYRGGYIWAPITNKAGTRPHHWTRLLDVREGDIILHGCGGYVQAVSVACGPCYECKQPAELTTENLWDLEGRRVDCDYTYIQRPIKTSTLAKDIIRYCGVKYAPFDRDGNGNMGYLFEINRDLAKIFINASLKANPNLGNLPYIQDLLSE